MTDDGVKLTREELYQKVWGAPATKLPKELGISDVALGKLCKRLDVPKPYPGYWSQLAAGRRVRREPLPPRRQGVPAEVIIHPTRAVEPFRPKNPEVVARLEAEARPGNLIRVAETLHSPHPLVRLTRQALEKAKPDSYGLLFCQTLRPRLRVRASRQSLRRALLIMDAILKALVARGYSAEISKEDSATRVLIGDELRLYLQTRPWARENKRSWKDDEERSRRLKDFFGQRAIRDLTPMLIEKFKSELRKSDSRYKRPFSPATVNRYLQVLSRVLSMAYENGVVDSNPMSRVKRLREPEARERYLNQYSKSEEERLMKALAQYGEHVVALADLDVEVGMRLGELLSAKWADVDEANRFISVTKTKNDKPRLIPLTARALGILRRLRQDAPDEELIFDPSRTGRKRRQMMVCFGRAVEGAGIGDFHFHDLRHTFATRLRAANVHEYDIADLLGHSTTPGETRNTKVTRGYAHGVPQRLRDAVNSLEEGKRAILEGAPTSRQIAKTA